MKAYYTESVEGDPRPAIADLAFWREVSELEGEDVWIIHRINVPPRARGKGHGRSLLQQILRDADAEGVTLMLAPEASGGLDQNNLISWYHRHGFTFTRSLAMMERLPQRR